MRFSGPLQAGIICVYVLLFTTKLAFSVNNRSAEDSNGASSITSINQTTAKGSKIKMKNNSGHHTNVPYNILRRIRNQINNTRQQMKVQIPTIQQLYNSVRIAFKGITYNYEWLAQEHLFWYDSNIRHLNKRRKLKILIPNLYRSLLNFSVTFEELKSYGGSRSNIHNSVYLKREQILNSITEYLRQTLVEVESSLSSLHMQHWLLTTNASQVIGDSKLWFWNPPNTTELMIQDWGVLTLYYRFLKDWVQIFSKNLLFEYRHFGQHRIYRHNKTRNVDDFFSTSGTANELTSTTGGQADFTTLVPTTNSNSANDKNRNKDITSSAASIGIS